MQIKTTMKYHLIPFRISVIQKSPNNKCWRGCGEKGTSYTVVGVQIGAATMENSIERLLKKQKQIYHMIKHPHFWANIQKKKKRKTQKTLIEKIHASQYS